MSSSHIYFYLPVSINLQIRNKEENDCVERINCVKKNPELQLFSLPKHWTNA